MADITEINKDIIICSSLIYTFDANYIASLFSSNNYLNIATNSKGLLLYVSLNSFSAKRISFFCGNFFGWQIKTIIHIYILL
jgi:hypothetical protein